MSFPLAAASWTVDVLFLAPTLIATALIIVSVIAFKRLYETRRELHLSQARLKNTLEGSGDMLWDWNIRTGELVRINDGQLQEPDFIATTPPNRKNIHPQDLPRVELALKKHFSGNSAFFETSYRIKDNLGKWRWVLDRGKVIETDNNLRPVRMTGTIKDISRIRSTEERLNLFAKCVENLSDAIAIYDKQFKLVAINPSYSKLFGGTVKSLRGKAFHLPGYKPVYIEKLKKLLEKKGHWQEELKLPSPEGKLLPIEMSIDVVKANRTKITHYVVMYSDLTERKKAESELQNLSNHDRLTGLPNRTQFFNNLQKLGNKNSAHALLVFDLDNFKTINDKFGHAAGDRVLKDFAGLLENCCRKADLYARLSGDEFVILFNNK